MSSALTCLRRTISPFPSVASRIAEIIARKFSGEGDVLNSFNLVLESDGLARTKQLAMFHSQAAVDACCSMPESECRDALIRLCYIVLSRSS